MERINLDISWQPWRRTDHYVTKILKYIEEPFDKEAKAKDMFEKYYDDLSSKYYHMTAQEIQDMWEAAVTRAQIIGHALDDYIGLRVEPESMLMTMDEWMLSYGDDETIMKIVKGWEAYWTRLENLGYKFVCRERYLHRVSDGISVRGRFDMVVYYPPLDCVVIIDWKTSDAITSEKKYYGLKGPVWVQMLPKEKLTMYGLQTNAYRWMLTPLCNHPYKVVTLVVQIDKEGEAHAYKNAVKYDDASMERLLQWCILENEKNPRE